jgi:hypothetical protein
LVLVAIGINEILTVASKVISAIDLAEPCHDFDFSGSDVPKWLIDAKADQPFSELKTSFPDFGRSRDRYGADKDSGRLPIRLARRPIFRTRTGDGLSGKSDEKERGS